MRRLRHLRAAGFILIASACAPRPATPVRAMPPAVAGRTVDIGGQLIHINCSGRGSPVVVLESGAGDFAMAWGLVQRDVARFARVCSYDRGGYVWSAPGHRPRTYPQLNLELHAALRAAGEPPPYVMVGQSYGGFLVRQFAEDYRTEVAGLVLVDAIHEDQQLVIGGKLVRLRDWATHDPEPAPVIAADTALRDSLPFVAVSDTGVLEPPLDRLPADAQRAWRWAEAQPLANAAQGAEMAWSPNDIARMYQRRQGRPRILGDLALVVLCRTAGDYPTGLPVSAEALETERFRLQRDLAAMSTRGRLRVAPHSGHNIQLEAPAFVVNAIRDVITAVRTAQ